MYLKRETGDDGEGVEADGKDGRKQELEVETRGMRVSGRGGKTTQSLCRSKSSKSTKYL